jgi:hypothetical protein
MKKLNLGQTFLNNVAEKLKMMAAVLVLVAGSITANAQSELVFTNPSLSSGQAGKDGATYRFPSVTSGVDALIKITGRSSQLVKLETIDLTDMGHNKAFQPQVTYNDGATNGSADWWMEFQVTFVAAGTSTSIDVSSFKVTALDIDGNGDRLNEYVSFYRQKSSTLESNSLLSISTLLDIITNLLLPGKKFSGPVTNYADIDTSATRVMVTNQYENASTFILRTGARATGSTSAADRMYSFWFKGFTYSQPSVVFLPATLINWNATYNNGSVALGWTTTMEKNVSHFTIERSTDGIEYTDAGMIITEGNSDIKKNYSFTDKLPASASGNIYYRLKAVDLDGRTKTSDIRVVRIGKQGDAVKMLVYPNPATTDVRITVPQSWQNKTVTYELLNTSGQVMQSMNRQHANQTEIISLSKVPMGMYIMRVSNGTETGSQAIVKAN